MEEKLNNLLSRYKGQSFDFALEIEKEGKTLPQHLTALFEAEMASKVRKEKESYINTLEQLVLVWNNNVLMGKLQSMRDQLEEENKGQ